jgi:hypothetical protein
VGALKSVEERRRLTAAVVAACAAAKKGSALAARDGYGSCSCLGISLLCQQQNKTINSPVQHFFPLVGLNITLNLYKAH